MKKNWKRMACGMAAAAVFSMTACTAGKETAAPAPAEEEVQETQEVQENQETQETQEMQETQEVEDIETEETSEDAVLLEDYYNTPEGKAALEADYADLAGEGMSVELSVVMDEIVVTVKYEDSSLLTEGIEETLAQQLESMTERFWKQTIAYDEIIEWRSVLTVRYVDPEGNVLAEQSYSAE